MAFYGYEFIFDGVSCAEYGLMMYDFGTKPDTSNTLVVNSEIVEDRIPKKYAPLHYGTITNKPLEFTMTFGINVSSAEKKAYLDRHDLKVVAEWLTSHDTYKWLEIAQPDMEMFRYKCFIKDLKYIDVGSLPRGFSCKVICDSPFAYLYPEVYEYEVEVNEENEYKMEIDIFNKSSYHGYYKPEITLSLEEGGTFKITNVTDNNRVTCFNGLPTDITEVRVDNENEIISCNTSFNPYECFNFNFTRLLKGNNYLIIEGKGKIKITCEFPVNIGG